MLARLFRRHRPQLPTSSAELAEALRTAAQFADTESAKLEYTNAADALDRAITHTRQHGDEPTRDALAYALGRAELNLKDQMAELIELTKDNRIETQGIHLLVQTVHTAQSEQGAVLEAARAEFHNGLSEIGERVTDNTARIEALEQKVSEHDLSRDRSIDERRQLQQDMAESKAHRAHLQTTLNQIDARLATIEQLLEVAGDHDRHSEAGG